MTPQAGAIRQPDSDLVAFDVRRQSPEQIALLFARWKEQRKQLHHSEPPPQPERPHLRPMPPIVRAAAQVSAPVPEKSPRAVPPSNHPPTGLAGQVHYSATFAALLTTRIEPNKAQRIWTAEAGLSKLRQPNPPQRHSGLKWILAGAASVVALVAVPGDDGLREPSWLPSGRMQTSSDETPAADAAVVATVAEVASSAVPAYPMDIDTAEPFVAIATAAPVATEWPLQQTIDLALMKVVPVAQLAQRSLMPRLKPPVPLVRTASKLVEAPEPVPFAYPQSMPKLRPITPVELRIIPSSATALTGAAPAITAVREAPAAERPASELEAENGGSVSSSRRGNNNDNGSNGSSRIAVSADKAPASTGSGGSASPGSGAGTGGTGDPASGGTDGSGSGDGSGTGGDAGGGDTGGGDTGGGDTGGGDTGGGDSGGGDTGGGDTGGGDTGGGDTGGGDTGGGDTGGGDTGGGDTGGGDTGGGDTGGGDTGGAGGGDAGGADAGGAGGGGDTGGGDTGGTGGGDAGGGDTGGDADPGGGFGG